MNIEELAKQDKFEIKAKSNGSGVVVFHVQCEKDGKARKFRKSTRLNSDEFRRLSSFLNVVEPEA